MLLNIFSCAYLSSLYPHWWNVYWKISLGVLVWFVLTNVYSHITASASRVEKVSLTPKSSLCPFANYSVLHPPCLATTIRFLLLFFFCVLKFHTHGIIIVCSLLCLASFFYKMILRITRAAVCIGNSLIFIAD